MEQAADSSPLQLRGPFTRWPRVSDTVLAIALFVFAVFVEFVEPNDDVAIRAIGDLSIGALLVAAAACGALIWRRTQPLIVLGVTVGAIVVIAMLDYPETIGFAMLVALYSAGRYVEADRWSYIALGGTLAAMSIANFITSSPATDLVFGFFVLSGVWYVGRRVQIRVERAAQYEREQLAEAHRAVIEERTRIARELHDVVAHQVTLMTVQAGAAKTVATDDPEAAYEAMEAVETAGREALGELRHLLGVLRPDAEARDLSPLPGIADVPRLVDQFAETGLSVSLTMDGLPADPPAAVDLSAYRIVQEALTNVLKHAGPGTRTTVRLDAQYDEIVIEVLDDGARTGALPGSGHGIGGMRERALLLGGSLDAGPRSGGGFQVVARLPIGAEPA